jgi:hypothetical protein
MPIKITIDTPEKAPPLYLDFLHHLLLKYPQTHPNTDCTVVMKHTNTVGGRPGHFFGSRPFGRNYSWLSVALGRPESPHQATSVLCTISHEYSIFCSTTSPPLFLGAAGSMNWKPTYSPLERCFSSREIPGRSYWDFGSVTREPGISWPPMLKSRPGLPLARILSLIANFSGKALQTLIQAITMSVARKVCITARFRTKKRT